MIVSPTIFSYARQKSRDIPTWRLILLENGLRHLRNSQRLTRRGASVFMAVRTELHSRDVHLPRITEGAAIDE